MSGVLIAFMDYKPFRPLLSNKWVGLKYFLSFFKSPLLPKLIRNTLIINGWNILVGFPIPIIFALLLNELRRLKYKKVVQTVSYFPHFISWVIVYGLALNLFSPSFGLINILISKLGGKPVNFLMQESFFVPLLVGSGVYVNYGWGSIIYLAALTGIDQEYYEAAKIDGANDLVIPARIILPLSTPVIATIGLFYAVAHWNEWFNALIFINDPDKFPLQLVPRFFLINRAPPVTPAELRARELTEAPSDILKMTAIVISITPILAVYPFVQKYFVKGIIAGSIKG